MRRLLQIAVCAAGLCGLAGPLPAAADEIPPGTEKLYRERFEVRLGGFAHSVGGVERGSADINGEIVFPDFFPREWRRSGWSFLVPRLHAGFMANTVGKTSYGYVGGLWTVDFTRQIFAELFIGGAVHNGTLAGAPGRLALGCNPLFHVGANAGYRLTDHWSVMFTFAHISNGNAVLNACGRNQGMNEYGGRVGYSF